jgi:hypothetical protein
LEIDKSKQYEIIVFPNQDEGLKAPRVLVSKGVDFKSISTLAVVVPHDCSREACQTIINGDALMSGHYPFLYRDYEEDFFKRAKECKAPESRYSENKKIMQEMAEALGVA